MAKAEINNEFVLLRHAVRQARICIVNKLIKEAKNLRNKNGTEAQLEKNKRKSDKLIAEVYALKTIKDDEISRFGILNERGLTEILQDQSSSHGLRIMARIAYYKNLHRRIMQFRDKFPGYKKHFTERKKKSAKVKIKDTENTKSSSKEKGSCTRSKNSKKQKVESDENIDRSQDNLENEESCSTASPETENNSCKRQKSLTKDSTPLKKQKLTDTEGDGTLEDIVVDNQSHLIKPCNVTKEATVKRFAEFLKEEKSNVDTETTEVLNSADTAADTDRVKVVDDFFLTEDNKDYQGSASSISASTSYAKPHKHNTWTKSLQFSDCGKKQNAKYKNNVDVKKYPAERSSAARPERTTNKTAKRTNKNNPNDISNKKENADLHPSWLAKRKEQEVIKRGFQGKKIVFTDD